MLLYFLIELKIVLIEFYSSKELFAFHFINILMIFSLKINSM